MSNYCENTLYVMGKPEEILRFANHVYTENGDNPQPLDFNKIIPYPKDSDVNSRHWKVEHWGTKDNARDVRVQFNSGEVIYDFDTPWSPPIEVISEMAKMFPELEFELEYQEYGMSFAGSNSYVNGVQITAEAHEISDEELVERFGEIILDE